MANGEKRYNELDIVTSSSNSDYIAVDQFPYSGNSVKRISRQNFLAGISGSNAGVYEATDYGVVADGTTDNSVALNDALGAMVSAGGGILRLPPGVIGHNSGMGSDIYSADYENIAIMGAGRDVTVLKNLTNTVAISFGTGNATLGLYGKNYYVSDLTIDMNSKSSGFNGALAFNNCQDVTLERVKVINKVSGAHAMLFFGSSENATSAMLGKRLRVVDCIFGNDSGTSTASWESITLAQGQYISFIDCTFQNQAKSQGMILNYGSHDVEITNCRFFNCRGYWDNGFGNTLLEGCNFYQASVFHQGWNTTYSNCTFDGPDSNEDSGIFFRAYQQSASESFWDALPAGSQAPCRNNKILDCTFRNCKENAITSDDYQDDDGHDQITSYDLEIVGCTISNTYGIGMDVKAISYLRVENCNVYNSGQNHLGYNFALAGGVIVFKGNRGYDDQAIPTTTRDLFIDNQRSALITSIAIQFFNNQLEVDNGTIYYYDGGFSTTQPVNITYTNQTYRSTGYDSGQVLTAGSDGTAVFQDIPPTLRTNLLSNPSFEVDLTGWSSVVNPVIGSSVVKSSAHAFDGTSSMKFTNTGAHTDDSYTAYNWTGLEVDTFYTFSAYGYIESNTDTSFLNEAILAFSNTTGSPHNVVSTSFGTPTTGVWARYSVAFYTGSDTSGYLRLYSPQGVIYWDALVLELGSTAGVYIGYPGNFLDTLSIDNPSFTTVTSGSHTFNDAANLVVGTTTGTKIGTTTSQKLGVWNATPIVQPTTAISAATFTANTSAIANDTAIYGGYTIGQVVAALKAIGLLA